MTADLLVHIKKLFNNQTNTISSEYKNELISNQLKLNTSREKVISILLIILNILLTYIDVLKNKILWVKVPAFKSLFFAHIILIIYLIVHLSLLHIRSKKNKIKDSKFDNLLHLGFIIFILTWCTYLSINAQMIHEQISAYIIGAFCLSSCIVLTPKESLFIYSFTYLIFNLGIFIVQNDPLKISGNIINSSFLIIFACIISKINYDSFVKDFLNKKIILQKNIELDNSYKNLEEIVKKRTKDLTKANKLLIEEITMRHVAEMQAIKAQSLCEEKTKVLNEAKEYEKLRTDFFANISHELRTPLNVIFSAQQMLKLTLKNPTTNDTSEKVNKYIDTIKQNCYRLIRLIGNLIDITKMDAGYFEVNLQNHDIIKVVEDITLSVAEYIEHKNINLVFDTEVEEKLVACDPDKIERIILNLLSNAVKFTPENGNIYVNICDRKDKVIISIKDTGIGIPYEMQNVIFERFIQADKSISRNREGSGIGLSLVKSLVKMHNGSISLLSKPGEGTEFIINIPSHIISLENYPGTNTNYKDDQHIERINVEFSDIYL